MRLVRQRTAAGSVPASRTPATHTPTPPVRKTHTPATHTPAIRARIELIRRGSDLGMATAEYAIATLAACGFAGLLLTLLRSSEVRGLLSGLIRRALSVG